MRIAWLRGNSDRAFAVINTCKSRKKFVVVIPAELCFNRKRFPKRFSFLTQQALLLWQSGGDVKSAANDILRVGSPDLRYQRRRAPWLVSEFQY